MKPIIVLALPLFVCGCGKKVTPPVTSGVSGVKVVALGSFGVGSGIMVLSDPAFPLESTGEGSQVKVTGVKNGTWKAEAAIVNRKEWGERCVELTAFHLGSNASHILAWHGQSTTIGVDTGQAGIFDYACFRKDALIPKEYAWKDKPAVDNDLWYSLCCEKTLNSPPAGIVPGGAVASSGFGDGSYGWALQRNADGEVIGIRILFITKEDE